MLKGHVDVYSPTVIEGWAVDLAFPSQPVDVIIEVDGKVIARGVPDRYRPDVEEALGVRGRFGFSLPISVNNLWGKKFDVRFEQTNMLLENGTRAFNQSAEHVLVGQDNWYFEKSHQEIPVIDIMTLAATNNNDEFFSVAHSLAAREQRILKTSPYATLVVPDKSVVYREFLPQGVNISDQRIMKKLLKHFPQIHYPEVFLRNSSAITEVFHKNDSHMNDTGTFLCYSLLCESLIQKYDVELAPLHLAERAEKIITGDLSHENLGNTQFTEITLQFKSTDSLFYKNGVTNYGTVRYYRRPDCAGPRVLLCGTSSGLQIAKLLSYTCSELLYVFSHDFDYALLSEFGPDIAITIIPERFIRRPVTAQGFNSGFRMADIHAAKG